MEFPEDPEGHHTLFFFKKSFSVDVDTGADLAPPARGGRCDISNSGVREVQGAVDL